MPLATFHVPSHGSIVEVAIWENAIELDGGKEATNVAASFKRSYRSGSSWKTTTSYRLHDLFALQHVVGKAIELMLERDQT